MHPRVGDVAVEGDEAGFSDENLCVWTRHRPCKTDVFAYLHRRSSRRAAYIRPGCDLRQRSRRVAEHERHGPLALAQRLPQGMRKLVAKLDRHYRQGRPPR